MRVFYKVNDLLMVSTFDDVTYYPKDSQLLFVSSLSDSIFIDNIDYETAKFILSQLYSNGKVDLTIYKVQIDLD